MSDLLFQIGHGTVAVSRARDRDELSALLPEFSQLVACGIRFGATPPIGFHFDHLIGPFSGQLGSPRLGLGGFAAGRRPALRSASRSTYSICAFRLRSSSSDQRWTAARISALMRSGWLFF